MDSVIKIAITEDKQQWRNAIKKALRDYDIITIIEAENGLELLNQLEQEKPDVVLLDLAMPIMNGSETMDVLMEKHPDLKVIIMSMYDDASLMDDYIKRGAKGCFPKGDVAPRMEELVKAIRIVSKGGTYYNYDRDSVLRFTKRQKEIITLLTEGKSSKEIASELGLSPRSVEKQKSKIMALIQTNSFAQMLGALFERGLKYFGRRGNKNLII